jgi:hypothetical protein
MKGQDKPRTPCHSGRETAATKLCKVFFSFFFFFFFFPFLFLSLLFSLPSFFLFLSFLSPFSLRWGRRQMRQEADLQGFGVVLKGL